MEYSLSISPWVSWDRRGSSVVCSSWSSAHRSGRCRCSWWRLQPRGRSCGWAEQMSPRPSSSLSGRSSSSCWVGGSALPGKGAAGWGSLNMYDLLVTLLELFTLRSTEMPLLYRNQFQFGLYFLRTSIRMNGLVIRENILQIQRNFVFRLLLWLSKCTRMCVRICWHGQILTPLSMLLSLECRVGHIWQKGKSAAAAASSLQPATINIELHWILLFCQEMFCWYLLPYSRLQYYKGLIFLPNMANAGSRRKNWRSRVRVKLISSHK